MTSKGTFFSIFFAIIAFSISMFIMPYYVNGDQTYYKKFYEDIVGMNIVEAYQYYGNVLSAQEPIYFLLVFLFNQYINKILFVSILNSLLFYLLSKVLVNNKVNYFVIFSLLLNFYILVIFSGAERLKIGFIILLLGMLYKNNEKLSNFFLFISPLGHLQMFIFLISLKLNWIIKRTKNFMKSGGVKSILTGILMVIFIYVTFFFLKNQITSKYLAYSSYSASSGLLNLIKPIFFLLLTLIYYKNNKFEIIVMNIPLILSSVILGEERIVIFSYFLFFFHVSKKNKGLNMAILITSIYFIYKGLDFIDLVIRYGDGFHS